MEHASSPFGLALIALAKERGRADHLGRINYRALARSAEVDYDYLLKALHGKRQPAHSFLERIARELGELPDYFAEYRMLKARTAFDPNSVGFNQALQNLETLTDSIAGSSAKQVGEALLELMEGVAGAAAKHEQSSQRRSDKKAKAAS